MRFALLLATILFAVSTPAQADRLIRTPIGDTLSLGSFRAEAARRSSNHYMFTGEIGLPARFEAFIRHHSRSGASDRTEFGGQFGLMSETGVLPAIAVGGWDLGNRGPEGRRFFVVASKELSLAPRPGTSGVRLHGGLGTNRFSGVFGGVEVGIGQGLIAIGEYDANNLNFGVHWEPITAVRVKGELWKGDIVVGVQLRQGM